MDKFELESMLENYKKLLIKSENKINKKKIAKKDRQGLIFRIKSYKESIRQLEEKINKIDDKK